MTKFVLNGKPMQVKSAPDTPLLWVIREELKMTGTKFGCGMAQCGACTVHLDGQAIRSCVTPISAVADKKITTIEGLDDTAGKAVVQAWRELNVVQCGYCQSGQIMSAAALLRTNAAPDDTAIDSAMAGNLCRCATYQRVRAAIHLASKTMKG
jgi:isoquinoline 1-oxidoreductase alpha subunit